jgi:hypothetical protein
VWRRTRLTVWRRTRLTAWRRTRLTVWRQTFRFVDAARTCRRAMRPDVVRPMRLPLPGRMDCRAWSPRETRETASPLPDCAPFLRRTIPISAFMRAESCVQSVALDADSMVAFCWRARWMLFDSEGSEFRRRGGDSDPERGIEGGADDQSFTGNSEARGNACTASELCPAVTNDWRSE